MELNNNKTIVAIVVLKGVAVVAGAALSHFATKKHLKSKILQLKENFKQLESTVDFKNFLARVNIIFHCCCCFFFLSPSSSHLSLSNVVVVLCYCSFVIDEDSW